MDDIGSMVVDTATRILRDHCDLQMVNNAKDDGWKESLWRALEESGLTLSWVPEDKGGSGVDVLDGFEVLQVAGRFAVAVPLAETMLAGWLLARAGITAPSGAMTVAPCDSKDDLHMGSDGIVTGHARGVPFASQASRIVVAMQDSGRARVAVVDRAACTTRPGTNIAEDPQDHVTFEDTGPLAAADLPAGFVLEDIMTMGAAIRARQMAGALAALLDLTADYARQREAFGRPIGKFQAIQHALARLAGEVAAAEAVSVSAADAIDQTVHFDDAVFLEVAAAKIRVGEAAGEAASIAHQVFGAIGFTREHVLHRLTRRLWAWRDDFGSESHWAVRLGTRVAAKGADELWPALAAR